MTDTAWLTIPLFLLVFYVAVGLFLWRATYLFRLVLHGRASRGRLTDLPRRSVREVVGVLFQSKLFLRPIPGLMHLLIFWGFLVLLPTIAIAFLGAMDASWSIPWLSEQGWFAFLVDLFAALVLVGVAIALSIRLILRPVRFVGSYLGVAYTILAFEAAISITLFVWHGARIALGLNEAPAAWAPISNAVAGLLGSGPNTATIERLSVWAHAGLILAFLVYIPYTKHLHTLVVWFNVFLGRTKARGRLEPLVFDDPAVPEDQIRFGMGTIADMTWKQMVDGMTCTECGRCQDACPAFSTGKNLSPKLVVMNLRDQLYREGHAWLAADGARDAGLGAGNAPFVGQALVPQVVRDDTVWDCVTCGACVRECPVGIEHIDHIVDLRRNLVMVESKAPKEGLTMLRDLERTSNPWGRGATERVGWAAGLDVRVLEPGDPPPAVLFWVGCAPAFDERARLGARSTAQLLKAAGVDFAILGPREACNGDPARRMGDEYTFQALAKQNIETLDAAGISARPAGPATSSKVQVLQDAAAAAATIADRPVTKIVTTCPHCFNTIGQEYPDFGGHYEVVHHTQLLAELVADGRLSPAASDQTITYHDSCYLARHNDVRAEPRSIVSKVGVPLEMARREERTFCCGAGGAHMWLEERGNQINEERARQAVSTGAETLAVACPFCTVMLDDGMKGIGGDLVVKDVATLLLEGVERGQAASPVNQPQA